MTPKSPSAPVLFRSLPAMNRLLDAFCQPAPLAGESPEAARGRSALAAVLPRPLLREALEDFLDSCRVGIREGHLRDAAALSVTALLAGAADHVARVTRPCFRRVLNATGVVVHTNLGRSLLADEAVRAVADAAASYSNLEFDLDSGARGSRYSHVEALICRLTGAEAALVVNNNAAAVLLMLDTLCKGREVIVSRGELVEIGGSFRIPEVMEKSGCILREAGATNRTHLKDYQAAVNENTAALMKVHASNFRIIGFTSEVAREDLALLAREKDLPLLEDLGSGTLFDFAAAGLAHLASEPTAARVLARGVDVVSFSGDKVLGGPQAGIIAGRSHYIERIKKNPLNRALRIDKMTLAALEATLRLYLDPELAKKRIPTLRMLCMDAALLRRRATKLARLLERVPGVVGGRVRVGLKDGASRTGGGAFPELDLPTRLVTLTCDGPGPFSVKGEPGPTLGVLNPDGRSTRNPGPGLSLVDLREALLRGDPPLVARLEENALCLDPRTLTDDEFALVAAALHRALENPA